MRDWTSLLTPDELTFLTLAGIDLNAYIESYLQDQFALYQRQNIQALAQRVEGLSVASKLALLSQVGKLVNQTVTDQAVQAAQAQIKAV